MAILLSLMSESVCAQALVTGTVFDTQGTTLAGASVMVVGTNAQTLTDARGQFVLNAQAGDRIQVSFVGFEPAGVVVQEEKALEIFLTESLSMLEEVVVVGYGATPRSDVTGAVGSLSQRDFIGGNITTSLQQIQGKIPGLVITQPGGDPNSDFNVRVRGATSLEGQPPLVVIDGVAIDDFNRAITTLNPNDIASYDVLKDASAAAIYGSRGANGVILITTKKAKTGKATFQYSGFGSVETIARKYDVLSRDQWLAATDTAAHRHYDEGADTDWQQEITRTAYSQSHTISASGGSDLARVYGSVGYLNQQGIVINTGKEVITARVSADIHSADEKLAVTLGINTSVIDRDLLPDQTSTAQVPQGGAAVFPWANSLLPIWPVYNEDGTYYQPSIDTPNPVYLLEGLTSNQKQNFFQTSVRGDYEVLNHLKIGASAALSNGNDVYSRFWPPRLGTSDKATAGKSDASKRNFTGDLHVNYEKRFGDHAINVMGVYEYNDFINEGFGVNGTGQVVEGLLLSDNLASATPTDMSSFKNEVKIISYLGRFTYDFKDRYLLTINFRRDGSSRFGPSHRWGNFPSAAVVWRLTNENFMSRVSWLDMKVRLSYGLTGNQENLAPNSYQNLYGPAGSYYFNGSYGQSYGVVREANPDLKWEVRKSVNMGIDFSLWGDRVKGMLDVFSDKTSDMLFLYNIPQPPFVTNQAFANAADATNKGIELSVGAAIINQTAWMWNVRANIAVVRNRVTNLLGQFKGFDLSVTNTNYGYASGGTF
ncbi:MAG TPA: SusC/RagA family TonB-linked outer membrane protein, partial [Chryseolinea sp.]|nr:SusC/RagA family TonB-linked outer membrane protein [Chryseolinea sp.]